VLGEIRVALPFTIPTPRIPRWVVGLAIGLPLLFLGFFLWRRTRPRTRGPMAPPRPTPRRPGSPLIPPAPPRPSTPSGKDIRPD
jgi:hypothetical protein